MEGKFGGIKVGSKTEEELAFDVLFPGLTPLQRLQMISEYNARTINPFSVLGVLRRLYSGNGRNFDPWYVYQEEYSSNRISLERKGRLEASEIVAAVRRKAEEED